MTGPSISGELFALSEAISRPPEDVSERTEGT